MREILEPKTMNLQARVFTDEILILGGKIVVGPNAENENNPHSQSQLLNLRIKNDQPNENMGTEEEAKMRDRLSNHERQHNEKNGSIQRHIIREDDDDDMESHSLSDSEEDQEPNEGGTRNRDIIG